MPKVPKCQGLQLSDLPMPLGVANSWVENDESHQD